MDEIEEIAREFAQRLIEAEELEFYEPIVERIQDHRFRIYAQLFGC